jgi:CRISPR/Cas system-associated endonuclease/helicase Cas3
MSATLGETALAILMDRDRKPIDQAVAAPYPSIRRSTCDRQLPGASERITDVLIDGFEQTASRARAAAAEGQCVLWLRSTVSDAAADFQNFEAHVDTMLHHSRYAVEDRTWLDEKLL